ncbi:hypothetical protein, partial [Marinimicrobium locisalis]|uniref:hypothetical protein n=1 Tax=Marinimicrobium locisalis TaxID=546022 RepID=UPI003221C6B1
ISEFLGKTLSSVFSKIELNSYEFDWVTITSEAVWCHLLHTVSLGVSSRRVKSCVSRVVLHARLTTLLGHHDEHTPSNLRNPGRCAAVYCIGARFKASGALRNGGNQLAIQRRH